MPFAICFRKPDGRITQASKYAVMKTFREARDQADVLNSRMVYDRFFSGKEVRYGPGEFWFFVDEV